MPKEARVFGSILGVQEGQLFVNRKALHEAGVHRPLQAGISGSASEGADSIVLSGGYEDDEDLGEVIVYTGHGGNDPETGQQIADQTLTKGNLGLYRSLNEGLPVRVVRGAGHPSKYSPPEGYSYDGLYQVEDAWQEKGKSGFLIHRFRLRKIETEAPQTEALETAVPSQAPSPSLPSGQPQPSRSQTTVTRTVRDTQLTRDIKALHDHTCQVCGVRLEANGVPYAEAAHIRPLGQPHNGPDTPDNILCLCPNHHVLFDRGAFAIADDLTLVGLPGHLRIHPKHGLNPTYLAYHRQHYQFEDIADE